MKPKKILLSPKADQDFVGIREYSVENFGRSKTKEYLFQIKKSFKNISKNPSIGKANNKLHPNIKYLKSNSHLIFYKNTAKHILIIRILHQSMNYKNHL